MSFPLLKQNKHIRTEDNDLEKTIKRHHASFFGFLFCFVSLVFVFVFLGPHPQRMDVPRLGEELELHHGHSNTRSKPHL